MLKLKSMTHIQFTWGDTSILYKSPVWIFLIIPIVLQQSFCYKHECYSRLKTFQTSEYECEKKIEIDTWNLHFDENKGKKVLSMFSS